MTSLVSQNVIRWFESAALDAPHLRSPQPCKRGIHCDYKLKDEASGELVRACCSGVHPGEEGTGRRLFPARILEDGREQPACVRLTGASHGFYERRRLHLSWAEWCEQHEIPFSPALPGKPFEPVFRSPLGGKPQQRQERLERPEGVTKGAAFKATIYNPEAMAEAEAKAKAEWELEFNLALEPRGGREYRAGMEDYSSSEEAPRVTSIAPQQPQAQAKLTKNQRKRRNKRARLPAAYGTAEAVLEEQAQQDWDERCASWERAANAHREVSCEELEAELRAGAHSPKPQVVPPPALDLASVVRDMVASGVSMANCEMPSPGLPCGPPAPLAPAAEDDGGKTPCLAGTQQD